ncbi:MAG: DNA polymerase [Pseudomonas sp.]
MKYMTFDEEESDTYPVALLVRYLTRSNLSEHIKGIKKDVVAYALKPGQKAKNTEWKAYTDELLPILCSLQTDYLLVTEAPLFKFLTKVQNVAKVGGYVYLCVLKGFEHFKVIYMPSPGQVIRNPAVLPKVHQALYALNQHRKGLYLPPGIDVIKFEEYPGTVERIQYWLDKLVDTPLAMDIEAYALKHYDAGLGTITLCWNQHEGIAFTVDVDNSKEKALLIRAMLKVWFMKRNAKTIWHRGTYDVTVLIYQLFMDGLLDTKGLLLGLEHMMRGFEDSLIVSYLATNSCAGNVLGLKEQSQEFSGDYAEDVKDITQVETPRLLTYNLIDGLSTWYVYNKHYPAMVADEQEELYRTIFLPGVKDVIQMQLTGMPLDMAAVRQGKKAMSAIRDEALDQVRRTSTVKRLVQQLSEEWAVKRNSELKVKRVTPSEANLEYNLNSPLQTQKLLHEVMGLPVLESTDKGQPATGMDALKNLSKHTDNIEYLLILTKLIEFAEVDKILSSFIPAFEAAPQAEDGWHYVFGFFNLGGTVSGRLSSNGPNMQNIPSSGTKYAAIIKQMFMAPYGWVFVGLDFNSLEDRVSALTTKDPNKLKVYTDGYDGHSLRAFSYWPHKMPDITMDPDSVNSIGDVYPALRQDSKAPTFLLTYGGTYHGLILKCGFTKDEALEIEKRYHTLYEHSDKWVAAKLDQAAKDGYVTVAFGLRVRTPLLAQTIHGTRTTPYEAQAERRTAGNALGQSWGLLNTRAGSAFMGKVRSSDFKYDIRPCAHIHDAQYYLVREDVAIVQWLNTHLVKEVQWQEAPEIQHDEVKLGGTLAIYHPSWDSEIKIPNNATIEEILTITRTYSNDC